MVTDMNAPLPHAFPILDLDVLRTFAAIADTGSFSTAANTVFRTPSAVSMQIKKLEEMLGRALFNRDARSVSLTADGEILLGFARRMLALNNEAVANFVVPDVRGVARVGAPDDIGERILPTVLKRFACSHPGVSVDVVIDQSTNLRRRMEERRLDIALFNCSPKTPAAANGEILFEESLVWAGAKGGTAHRRDPLPVSIWEDGCAWRANALEALEREGRDYRVAYLSGHVSAQRAAIVADLAVAPLPRSAVGQGFAILGSGDGLPSLGRYQVAMAVAPGAPSHVQAVADHFRAAFEEHAKDTRPQA